MGVIPTFVFYAVLCSAVLRLLAMARMPKVVILSFNHRLSFRLYSREFEIGNKAVLDHPLAIGCDTALFAAFEQIRSRDCQRVVDSLYFPFIHGSSTSRLYVKGLYFLQSACRAFSDSSGVRRFSSCNRNSRNFASRYRISASACFSVIQCISFL